MKKLRRRLLIFSIIFAILSSLSIYIYLDSLDETEEVEIEMFTILVANGNIPPRTKITDEMISVVEVPFEPKSDYYVNTREDIVGKYAKSEIYLETQFHKDSLMVGKDEELSVKISGNMRAVSVGVSGDSGVSNLIKPGDRVDVVMFLSELKGGDNVSRPDIVKMLLQNVEVLAIDLDLNSREDVLGEEKTSAGFYLATLAVPVFEVENLILAKSVGSLELVLRPIDGDYLYATEGVIWQELLVDDFNMFKDMFPNYGVNSVGEVYVDPNEFTYDKYVYYTVKYGDTLKEISLLFYGNESKYELLKQVNNISDENVISSGMGIKIPVIEDAIINVIEEGAVNE